MPHFNPPRPGSIVCPNVSRVFLHGRFREQISLALSIQLLQREARPRVLRPSLSPSALSNMLAAVSRLEHRTQQSRTEDDLSITMQSIARR